MKELETDRLILRKITLDDREDMFNNWASDPKTSEMLGWDVHESVDVTKKVIQNWNGTRKSTITGKNRTKKEIEQNCSIP